MMMMMMVYLCLSTVKEVKDVNLDSEQGRSQFVTFLAHFLCEMREEQGIGYNLQCPTVELETRGKSWILP